jgi:lysophospholipid acyltransferase (LPLAT)-like uncharacterized protein
MVPMPFARAVIVFGDPIFISADDDESKASFRIEKAINDAQDRAEVVLESWLGRKRT